MKKIDIAIVVLLFILLIGWITFYPKLARTTPQAVAPVEQVEQAVSGTNEHTITEIKAAAPLQADKNISEVDTGAKQSGSSNAVAGEASFHADSSPQTITLSSASACATVSSWGGGIVGVRLEDFLQIPTTNPLNLIFSDMPALAYNGLPGLSLNHDFAVTESNHTIRINRDTAEKLRFERSLSFVKNHVIKVVDEFTNLGSEPIAIPEHSMNVGPMRNNKGETSSMGVSDLGIDSQAKRGAEGTRHWGSGGGGEPSLAESFLPKENRGGCAWFNPQLTRWLEPEFHRTWVSEIDWVAVKNKFFVQILMPKKDEAGIAFVMNVKRAVTPAALVCTAGSLRGSSFEIHGNNITVGSADSNIIVLNDPSVSASHCTLVREGWNYHLKAGKPTGSKDQVEDQRLGSGDTIQIGSLSFMFRDGERPDTRPTWAQTASLDEVSAAMVFEGRKLAPGEKFVREIEYYVGPKKYPLVRDLGKATDKDKGKGCDKVMEFGRWEIICLPLLWIMNALHSVVPNYGVAIILLTILIRLVFWPVMQKSAENSRKMQELQPQLAVLKEQYKDDQQQFLKKQQELFKQNKVSVLGGCLPMLIQMPILFGLFFVLRSAVELRGAEFLWIKDLSEAERLFPGIIPFWPHHLNILPILMTIVQIWQMKITPTPGDQQMQKMMLIFMPFFMLYLLYDMASGLVLYWTISQVLAILQIILEKKRKHKPVVSIVSVAGKK